MGCEETEIALFWRWYWRQGNKNWVVITNLEDFWDETANLSWSSLNFVSCTVKFYSEMTPTIPPTIINFSDLCWLLNTNLIKQKTRRRENTKTAFAP